MNNDTHKKKVHKKNNNQTVRDLLYVLKSNCVLKQSHSMPYNERLATPIRPIVERSVAIRSRHRGAAFERAIEQELFNLEYTT